MILSSLKANALAPIKAMRWRYLPLLMIYFAYGASSFSGIAESFFIKERLSLPAAVLIQVGVWLTIPWTIKMVFGQLADCVPLFGSLRKSYVCVAAILMAAGSILLTGLAAKWSWVMLIGSEKSIYLLASLLPTIGVVLQDVIADAMSVEVVERAGRTEQEVNQDLAMVQLLGRLALSLAIFAVAGLGGWLAEHVAYQDIFLSTLIIPVISISGILLIKLPRPVIKPINKTIFWGGILYALLVTALGVSAIAYEQEITLMTSLVVITYFLYKLTNGLDANTVKKIFCAAVVIFIYRAMPSVGPALQWWEIDVLGFDPGFFGVLAQISAGLMIAGMWLFARFITEKPVGVVFIALSIVGFILSIPVIGMYYGLHEWTQQAMGFGARTIAFVDVALSSPFTQLSMIPMLALIARYAPRGNAATWFALMGSFMNLALMAGGIFSKHLNQIWLVTREVKDAAGKIAVPADYHSLGYLLVFTTIIGLVVPIISVFIFLREDLKNNKDIGKPGDDVKAGQLYGS